MNRLKLALCDHVLSDLCATCQREFTCRAHVHAAASPASTLKTPYPSTASSGWRTGPIDSAGFNFCHVTAAAEGTRGSDRCVTPVCCNAGCMCNVSEQPLMCSSINWSASELVVGSSDHALYVVDLETGKKRRTLYTKTAGHSEWVTACQCLPDGRILSGGMDSQLCLWESNSTSCQQLSAHAAPISAIDVSHATGAAVSASYDKSVRVWDVKSRRASESSCLSGHTAPVLQLVCGREDHVLSGDRGGTVIMWGLATGSTTSKLKDAHTGHVTALAWHHDASGTCIDSCFSGGQDGHLKM